MNRKQISFWLLLFWVIPTIASAQQLTKADIQALAKRVQMLEMKVSNLEITVKEMDKRMTAQIQAVNARIDELDKHLATLINILVGVVLAAIALPQVLGYLQGRRERAELQKQIRELGQRLEHQQQEIFEKLVLQQQEIELLKSRWLITPP